MKIIIADDRAENRYMLDALLRANGHESIVASNGVEVIEHARAGCDLVVSDVLMPKMDGFTLCRMMKADDTLRRIPIIFYTATYTDAKDAEFGLALGAERYLVKPVEPDELLRMFIEVAAAPAKLTCSDADFHDDSGYLREYNSRLISKLEQKSLELNDANRALTAELAQREKLELQLRHAQKLDALGRLAAGIAHDFNNILGGIVGHSELARMDAAAVGTLPNPHFDAIGAAAHRAHDLVQQILTFSRQKERFRKPLHLHAALEDALKLLRASLPPSIEIRCELDTATPTVLADLTEIHQLATNLVTNAWHAIGDAPGVILIKTDRYFADIDFLRAYPELAAGEYVRLSVSDTGTGIEPATLDNIFDPFFTTKVAGKGSGLGLAVVHGIMKACGGAVTVQSQLGKGATFYLYLPAITENVPTDVPPAPAPPTPGNGQRVLFIDDDTALTVVGRRFLEALGYSAEIATDPIAAMVRFRDEKFDLVVTDLTMPNASGLEVARSCHAIRPDVPVILMTGYNPSLDPQDLRNDGVVAILLKPYTIQTFGKAVAEAFTATRS